MTPTQALQAATADVTEFRLAPAHEKFSWLYDNALAKSHGEPGLTAGILLPAWAKLARHHPPAMQRVVAARDQLAAQAAEGGYKGQAVLLILHRVNVSLQDAASTRDAFARFAARDPVLAETAVFNMLPAFIALQDYEAAARYLQSSSVTPYYERMIDSMKRPAHLPGIAGSGIAQRGLQRHTDMQLARIALVLVKTGRQDEAEQLVQHFQARLGPEVSTHHMAEALKGIVPPIDEP
ncbi:MULTISPECIES: hypothetical protein [unclassified Roseateles]|uniref:hypothetical protein n=1 Tax=unclassified Roseateles TaxID=2626991 RepID=UPI0006FDE583|nr:MULTISPECIES: hypothetical protein [unclassified Roseateles]KQW44569.1 hypothetical protein ASC81_13270 [Pelomonas sp. Root405]KRA69928.1 hypothetical protein ASD88_17430 [Pelomonas sp. Root662]